MLAAKLIWKCLEKEGVETIFGYPGGALLPMYEALRSSSIKHVLVRNEQSAPHMASGYARESCSVGVCLATSGPGATNLITGIATAFLDSIPLVAITGQVNRDLIGTDAFQEADIFGATTPFTKHSYLVKDPEELPRIIHEAFHIATTGRPGPVLIDIPRDVQNENIHNVKYVDAVNIRGYKPTYEGHTGQIKRALRKIKSAKRPVIYAGGGVRLSHARPELLAFAERARIPVITTMMGISCFPENHPLYCGVVGSHGFHYSNLIMAESDLCICVGARMSDRGTGGYTGDFDTKQLIHIDIDPAEIGKNINNTNIPIVGDAKRVLSDLTEKVITKDLKPWLKRIDKIKADNPVIYDDPSELSLVNPKRFVRELSEIAPEETTLFGDVGLNQIWAALHFKIYGERKFFTSGGMGTMGYAIPGAVGATTYLNDADIHSRTVIAMCGDGSFQMAMADLGVIAAHNLPVKIIVMNNTKLGMVRQLQHDVYGKNHYSGTDIDFNVDLMRLVTAYGIPGYRAATTEEALDMMKTCFDTPGPTLLECLVDPDFMYI